MSGFVSLDRFGAVACITLDRHERRNAIGSDMLDGLERAWRTALEDAGCRAIVLCGKPPGFCAGADLKEMANLAPDLSRHFNERLAEFARGLRQAAKPVVAAVDGFAIGAGLMIAASCDLVVSAPDAQWHLPEVGHGWLPGFGLATLEERVGPSAAKRLTFGVSPIDGSEAFRLGLVDVQSGQSESPVQRALAEAACLAELPEGAVASCKKYFSLGASDLKRSDLVAQFLFESDAWRGAKPR